MQALLFAYHIDEASILQLLLQRTGFEVRTVSDLDKAVDNWPERPTDLALLAYGGEYKPQVSQVQRLRAQTNNPIVILSDDLPEETQVDLLEQGADLIVTRPYGNRFLIAQLRAVMRRAAGLPFFSLPILAQSGVMIDPSTRTVQVQEGEVKRLTQLEFRLLFTLMTHAGRVIPAEQLVEYVWGYSGEGNRGLVRGLVQRLRSKIEVDPANPQYIMTDPGIGYSFSPYQG